MVSFLCVPWICEGQNVVMVVLAIRSRAAIAASVKPCSHHIRQALYGALYLYYMCSLLSCITVLLIAFLIVYMARHILVLFAGALPPACGEHRRTQPGQCVQLL